MNPFSLPTHITIETVEMLAAEFKQLPLAEKSTVTLNASGVEAITTPGIQLIASLEKTLSEQGGTLIINGKSEALQRAFATAGLENILNHNT